MSHLKKIITNSERVSVALGIQHPMRMRRITLSSAPVWLYQIFFTSSHKQHDFRKKLIENKICLDFCTKFVRKCSQSRKKWARYDQKLYVGLHVKYSLFLSDFNETWIFRTYFRKILKYRISWKSAQSQQICSTRKNMKKLLVVFRNFAKVSKKNNPW